MAAVLGLSAEKTEEVLAGLEQVQIANYNCPGQIVISGRKESVEQAGPLLKEAGARRVLPLNVSGPFHSAMLRGAGEKLGEVLEHISLSELEIPYASNVTGELVRDSVFYCASVESVMAESGDFLIPLREGLFGEEHLRGTLGELLLGRKPGRTSPEEITVYESLGLAVEDIACAEALCRPAAKL